MTTSTQVSKFHFKTRTIYGADGKATGKTPKIPSVDLTLPACTLEDIVDLAQNGSDAVKRLLADAVNQLFVDQAKAQLEAYIGELDAITEATRVGPEQINFEQLTLEYIANIPPSKRGAAAISDEEWDALWQDFTSIMPEITGRPEDVIKKRVAALQKPNAYKAKPDVLEILIQSLQVYMANSAKIEDTGRAALQLCNKLEKWKASYKEVTADDLA